MKDLDQSDVEADAERMADLQELQEWVKRQHPNVEVRRETTSDDCGLADGWDYYLYIPYNEFKWPEPGNLFELRCKNHLEGHWSTKGPSRNLHWMGWGEDGFTKHDVYMFSECPCPVSDLVVRVAIDGGYLELEDESEPGDGTK